MNEAPQIFLPLSSHTCFGKEEQRSNSTCQTSVLTFVFAEGLIEWKRRQCLANFEEK